MKRKNSSKVWMTYDTYLDVFDFLASQTYDEYIVFESSFGKVFVMHNDKADSKDGINEKMLKKFKDMKKKGIVQKLLCCYASSTGVADGDLIIPTLKDSETGFHDVWKHQGRIYAILGKSK